jgi:uncharacterized damage-inducible protein DinB
MANLADTVAGDFASYYEYIAKQVHRWVDPLTQEQFWRNPYGYGNSAGHLVLHLTGNLSYYIGARVAETGYVRNRDREFTETEKPRKEDVMRKFDETMAMVAAAARKQGAEDWLAAYSAEREPEAQERFMIFLRCAGHAYHHVGQLIFLHKEFAKEAGQRTANA